MIEFHLNGRAASFDGAEDMPLLWALRDHFRLTGTKYACGIGRCGSCMVHVDGEARTACTTRIGSIAGQSVTTIEGVAPSAESLHPVQQAWLEEDVAQCGYCQPGQIMATVDLLRRIPRPTDADIDREITNLCRCGTYVRIRKAVHRAAALMAEEA